MKRRFDLVHHVLVLFIHLWVCAAKRGRSHLGSHQGLIRHGKLSEHASSHVSTGHSKCNWDAEDDLSKAALELCRAFAETVIEDVGGRKWIPLPRTFVRYDKSEIPGKTKVVSEKFEDSYSYDAMTKADLVIYYEVDGSWTSETPPGESMTGAYTANMPTSTSYALDHACPTGMVCPHSKPMDKRKPLLEFAGQSRAVLKPYGCGPQNLHTFVTHAYRCVGNEKNHPRDEDLGCNIKSYTAEFSQAHWNVPAPEKHESKACKPKSLKQSDDLYCAQKSCTSFCGDKNDSKNKDRRDCRSHGGELQCFVKEAVFGFECKCPSARDEIQDDTNICLEENFEQNDERIYNIPDYCSRAMVAELSQIFDGDRRRANLLSGAKHLGKDIGPICGTPAVKDLETLFEDTTRGMACWGFSHSYRELYCNVYRDCESEKQSEKQDPNLDKKQVQCCKDKWVQRQSRYEKHGLTYLETLPRYIEPDVGQHNFKGNFV